MTTDTSYTIEGVASGNYIVRVGACAAGACSEGKHEARGEVRVPTAADALGTPANLVLEASDGDLATSWDAVAGAESYQVRWRIAVPGAPFTSVVTTDTSYAIEGVTFGRYIVRVGSCTAEVCAKGKYEARGEVRVKDAPADLVLTAEEGELDFTVSASWSPVAGAAHYELRWKLVGATFASPVTTLDTSHEISGLSSGRYMIRVRAINEAGQMSAPTDRTVVVQAGQMYWTDAGSDKIQWANLDGSDVEDLVIGVDGPLGIALDVAVGKMYWIGYSGKIQRANLDGSGIEDLVTGLDSPTGIALDLVVGPTDG